METTSFSHRVKQEIGAHKPFRIRWKLPHAQGLFRYGRSFGPGEVSLHTESPDAAELFSWLSKSLLGRGTPVKLEEERRRGKTLYRAWLPRGEDRERLWELLEGDSGGGEAAAAYLAGAFLACGNVTDPEKGYHMEFVLRHPSRKEDLANLLEELLPGAKATTRRGHTVIYYKECSQIEDLLTLLGASKSCLSMIDVEMIKSVRNLANRATNCETANIDKLVSAASAQVEDIRLVLGELGEEGLPGPLRIAARLRLDHPDLSLRELAEIAPEPISRSGMHHRLDKLSKLAEEIRSGNPSPARRRSRHA